MIVNLLGPQRPPRGRLLRRRRGSRVFQLVTPSNLYDHFWQILSGILTGFVLLVTYTRWRPSPCQADRWRITTWFILDISVCRHASSLDSLVPGDQVDNSVRLAGRACAECRDIARTLPGKPLGRHRMTPVLSPKKTGSAIGGFVTASLADCDRSARPGARAEVGPRMGIGFGLSVGLAGLIGDLAESS